MLAVTCVLGSNQKRRRCSAAFKLLSRHDRSWNELQQTGIKKLRLYPSLASSCKIGYKV